MKIAQLAKTCGACPAQWEGRLEDGRYLYARYRWGCLSVSAGETLNDAIEYKEGLYCEQLGDSFDGVMSTEEMLLLAGLEWDGTGIQGDWEWD